MSATSRRNARVRIVLADRGWVLEDLASRIAEGVPGVELGDEPSQDVRLNYYFNYSAWRGRVSEYEAAFFTHIEEWDPAATRRFMRCARNMDASVCMADRYAEVLTDDGIANVRTIMPSVDTERFRPGIRVGVVGRNYHTGRKGAELVRSVLDVEGVDWAFAGPGWTADSKFIPDDELPAFYRSLDFLLVPAHFEGGPMPALEALASGTRVISSDVGFMNRLPHVAFKTGDAGSLREVLEGLVAQAQSVELGIEALQQEAWVEEHRKLFESVLERPRTVSVPARPLRVLLSIGDAESAHRGGPSRRVAQLAAALRELGHEAEYWDGRDPSPTGFDLIHIFNTWPADECLARIERARATGIPLVLSPIAMDHAESELVRPLVEEAHDARTNWARRQWASMRLTRQMRRRKRSRMNADDPYPRAVKQACGTSNGLALLSNAEYETLDRWQAPLTHARRVDNGIDVIENRPCRSGAFRERFGLQDYVLCVGRIEHRKNQALLLRGLRNTGLQVVLVGGCLDQRYGQITEDLSWSGLIRAGHLEGGSELLRSAFTDAAVFVLPSWVEGAPISALEAANCGTPLVLSDRSGEREYFGALAEYCDPASAESIREAVERAIAGDTLRTRRRRMALVRRKFSSHASAEQHLALYRSTLERQSRPDA